MQISLENYEKFEDKELINSPRSLEACNRCCVDPNDLKFKSLEEFADNKNTLEVIKMRFNYREDKRKGLLAQVKKERQEILKVL